MYIGTAEKRKRLCQRAKVEKGLAIHGTHVASAKRDVESWIKKNM